MDLPTFVRSFGRTGKGVVLSRIDRIKREGSPRYVWQVPVTAAAASAAIEIGRQFPASRKYEPLDSLELVNNETANDLTLTINGGDAYYCPAGTIRTVRGRGVGLWHISITNKGAGNTTLGLIMLSLQKEAMTIDKWAANQP